jgi:hypothetical protein
VLEELDVSVEPVAGGGDWDEMDRIFDEMARAPEQSFADFIAGVNAPDYVKQSATGFVEGFNAAYKERVSVEWLNRENAASDEIDGDRSFRVRAGTIRSRRFSPKTSTSASIRQFGGSPGNAAQRWLKQTPENFAAPRRLLPFRLPCSSAAV